jgi:hypothetical protein
VRRFKPLNAAALQHSAQSRLVKCRIQEIRDFAFQPEDRPTDMQELSRIFTEDVHPKKLQDGTAN